MHGSLRVLLMSHGLSPESVGGVEQHVAGLARALAGAGHEVAVYCRTGREGPAGSHIDESLDGIPVTRVVYRYEGLDSLRALYHSPLLEDSLRRWLQGRRFDVAHVHHLTGLSTGSLQVLAEAGIPAVLTLHDYWLVCPRGQMWHRLGERCERVEPVRCGDCLQPTFAAWLPASEAAHRVAELHADARATLAAASCLVVPSRRVLPPFEQLGLPPGKVFVVENGIDSEALALLPPARRLPGPLRVGYLGTLLPSKGLDVLVEALRLLPAGLARLEVHGNAVPYHGDEGFLTRTLARLQPGDSVRYHGPYQTGELPRILSGIDVLVVPALWHEAFGLTVREALAAGRPAIVSRVGGLQDAIEDGIDGYVVEPGDPRAIADRLADLARSPSLLEELASRTRRRIRSFSAMASDLVDVYRSARELDRSATRP